MNTTATTLDQTVALAARYDAFWEGAAPRVAAGNAALDQQLAQDIGCPAGPSANDLRRGITLLARPAPAVAKRLGGFLEGLRSLEPAQYYQPLADLHLTVLSLFTATDEYEPYLAHLRAYRAAVAEAVQKVPSFRLAIRGVTLSTGAVLAQGFPRRASLAHLRERLRTALTTRGLGGDLDRRYRLETAHLTLVRFATPLRDPALFLNALAAARAADFGEFEVERLELVLGDWYHTAAHERCLAQYSLQSTGRIAVKRE